MWDLNGNWAGDTRYGRWSINLFLFKGSEMGNVTEHDDEAQISMVSREQCHELVQGPGELRDARDPQLGWDRTQMEPVSMNYMLTPDVHPSLCQCVACALSWCKD